MKRGLKLLILSDLFILMGFGLVAPIISIFINESLIGGSIAAAGLATTIFLITKSIRLSHNSQVLNTLSRL